MISECARCARLSVSHCFYLRPVLAPGLRPVRPVACKLLKSLCARLRPVRAPGAYIYYIYITTPLGVWLLFICNFRARQLTTIIKLLIFGIGRFIYGIAGRVAYLRSVIVVVTLSVITDYPRWSFSSLVLITEDNPNLGSNQ